MPDNDDGPICVGRHIRGEPSQEDIDIVASKTKAIIRILEDTGPDNIQSITGSVVISVALMFDHPEGLLLGLMRSVIETLHDIRAQAVKRPGEGKPN